MCVQVNPGKYTGLGSALKTLVKEEGSTGIWKGFGPTFVGYSLQGMFKYGLYEVFKDQYSNLAGQEASEKYKSLIWLAGSASAEVVADIALCPLEMTKVKIQTSAVGTFPTSFGPAIAEMRAQSVNTKFPFGSLVPLWSRQVTSRLSARGKKKADRGCVQIPYTMAKFFFFEKIVSIFYTHVFTEPKSSYSKTTQLGVTFASGYLAGVVCAVVSHPADSLVSLLGKPSNKGKSVGTIISEVGMAKLATGGLGTRVVMIGTLTGTSSRTCAWSSNVALIFLTCRFPMVDLRFVQVRDGHGHDRWKVDVDAIYYKKHVSCAYPSLVHVVSRSSFASQATR